MLCHRLRNALDGCGRRIAVEEAGGLWGLDGYQLLSAASGLREILRPHEDRTLIVHLPKGPVYYAFLACAFLYRLDFCPLDIENPARRVLDVAAQFDAPIILCDDRDLERRFQEQGACCVRLGLTHLSEESEPRGREGRYFIATSGSTGVPKLVQVPHERTMPFLDWAIPFYGVDGASRWGQFSSAGFDLSLVDFLCALCGGGALIAIATSMDRIMPARALERARLTHWHSVPSMIPYFLREPEGDPATSIRVFSFCGEPFLRADAEGLARRYPGARIVNTYGPTEATLFCSYFEYGGDADPASAAPSLPIGHPIPGWNFVLLPEQEGHRLVILSDHLSDGYVGLSAPQFTVVRLFERDMKAFDTGDYLLADGNQLCTSRTARTEWSKLTGTGSIWASWKLPASERGSLNPVAAVVDARIVLAAEGRGEPDEMRAALGRLLPRASVPAEIRFVPVHPRTISGKLDRKAIIDAFGPKRG